MNDRFRGCRTVLTLLGSSSHACDGLSRRTLLQAAGAGLLGSSLARIDAADAAGVARNAKARSVIFLFLYGGPSQLETFDLKPEAPDAIRGPFRPITSRTPGLLISEHLPRTRSRLGQVLRHPHHEPSLQRSQFGRALLANRSSVAHSHRRRLQCDAQRLARNGVRVLGLPAEVIHEQN